MEKKIEIDVTVCSDTIAKMRNIEREVETIVEYNTTDLVCVSSGLTVDELMVFIEEMYALKADVFKCMNEVTSNIEDYVNTHVELDEDTATRINSTREVV